MNINNLIVYEDNSIIIFNKPQGIATTPGKLKNITEMVFNEFSELKLVQGYRSNEGGLLNRLDNETGGLLLFAKDNKSFKHYSMLMKKEKILKKYTAMVDGIPDKKEDIINEKIAHHYSDKRKMTIVKPGVKYRGKPRKAITKWKLVKTQNNHSLLKIEIKKGARHQIRLHLANIGIPIVGDKLYNKLKSDYPFHCLYADGVSFISNDKKRAINITINFTFKK